MKCSSRVLGLSVLALLLSSCWDRPGEQTRSTKVAKFGVFFGGQIQERSEIPFVLDSTRQTQGFRIELAEPAPRDLQVSWEVEMPAPAVLGRGKTIAKLGKTLLRQGETRLDQQIVFEPGDPLGLYNVRVAVGSELLIDRAVAVYDRGKRRRALDADD